MWNITKNLKHIWKLFAEIWVFCKIQYGDWPFSVVPNNTKSRHNLFIILKISLQSICLRFGLEYFKIARTQGVQLTLPRTSFHGCVWIRHNWILSRIFLNKRSYMFRNLCFHPFPTQMIESLYSFFVVYRWYIKVNRQLRHNLLLTYVLGIVGLCNHGDICSRSQFCDCSEHNESTEENICVYLFYSLSVTKKFIVVKSCALWTD